jgi:hypothetical protein
MRRPLDTRSMPSESIARRLTRRRLLAAAGAAATAGLAGCTLGDAPQVRCGGTGEGDNQVITTLRATPGERDAFLLIAVPASQVPDGLDELRVYDGDDGLRHEIPVQDTTDLNEWEPAGIGEDEVPFPVNLGRPPVHGDYRVEAIADGEIVGEATVAFNCFVDEPT